MKNSIGFRSNVLVISVPVYDDNERTKDHWRNEAFICINSERKKAGQSRVRIQQATELQSVIRKSGQE